MINVSSKEEEINVKDWIVLSTTMIGIVLTILALIWPNRPSNGIITATFLLMIGFILFVNSVSANSKAKFEIRQSDFEKEKVYRFVTFAEYSFGLGFTLVIIAFAFLGYKYLIDDVGKNFLILALPFAFLISAWVLIIIYNSINYSGKAFKILRSMKRNIWIFFEFISLIFIVLDYFEVIIIP